LAGAPAGPAKATVVVDFDVQFKKIVQVKKENARPRGCSIENFNFCSRRAEAELVLMWWLSM
jgi:hypothetical protein